MRQFIAANISQVENFALLAAAPRHTHQTLTLALGIPEEFFVVPVAQQRHGHALGLAQGDLQNALLQLIEVGKAVQIDIGTVQITALLQVVTQLLHAGARVKSLVMELGVVGGVQQRNVAQLVAHGVIHVRHLLPQRLRCDLIGVKLVRQLHQLLQKGGTLTGTAKNLQLAVHFLQGKTHGQQLTAVIQRKIRQTAGFAQHAGSQILKAQHLRVAGSRRSQHAAQVHLRLMGNMLRYQQDLPALCAPLRHSPQHAVRFAAAGPSDPDRQHGYSPFLLTGYHSPCPEILSYLPL